MGFLSITQTAEKWGYQEDEFRFYAVSEEFRQQQKSDCIGQYLMMRLSQRMRE